MDAQNQVVNLQDLVYANPGGYIFNNVLNHSRNRTFTPLDVHWIMLNWEYFPISRGRVPPRTPGLYIFETYAVIIDDNPWYMEELGIYVGDPQRHHELQGEAVRYSCRTSSSHNGITRRVFRSDDGLMPRYRAVVEYYEV